MDPVKMLRDLREDARRINTAIAALERQIRTTEIARHGEIALVAFELPRTEEQLAKGFMASPAMSYLSFLNSDGSMTFLQVNEAFQRATGYRRDELVGHTAEDLSLWADDVERQWATKIFRSEGRIDGFEYGFRRKDGKIRSGLMSAETVEHEGRMLTVVSALDITDRKRRAKEAAQKALAELAQAAVWVNASQVLEDAHE